MVEMTYFRVSGVDSKRNVDGHSEFHKARKRALSRPLRCFEGNSRQNRGETPQKQRIFRDPPPGFAVFCPSAPGVACFIFFLDEGNVGEKASLKGDTPSKLMVQRRPHEGP